MSNRQDMDAKAIIEANIAEGVSAENVTRLLNYHYPDTTFVCDRDSHYKATIRRVPNGTNYAPNVTIWTQP